MKRFISLLLIIFFFSIAIFGYMLFDMKFNHNGGCVASAVGGTDCPKNIVDFVAHYISTLHMLVTAIMPPLFSQILPLVFLFFVSVFLFYKNLFYPIIGFLFRHLRDLEFDSFHNRQKIIFWLSLLKFSPTF